VMHVDLDLTTESDVMVWGVLKVLTHDISKQSVHIPPTTEPPYEYRTARD